MFFPTDHEQTILETSQGNYIKTTRGHYYFALPLIVMRINRA